MSETPGQSSARVLVVKAWFVLDPGLSKFVVDCTQGRLTVLLDTWLQGYLWDGLTKCGLICP